MTSSWTFPIRNKGGLNWLGSGIPRWVVKSFVLSTQLATDHIAVDEKQQSPLIKVIHCSLIDSWRAQIYSHFFWFVCTIQLSLITNVAIFSVPCVLEFQGLQNTKKWQKLSFCYDIPPFTTRSTTQCHANIGHILFTWSYFKNGIIEDLQCNGVHKEAQWVAPCLRLVPKADITKRLQISISPFVWENRHVCGSCRFRFKEQLIRFRRWLRQFNTVKCLCKSEALWGNL